MDKDLKEALQMIKWLRADLGIILSGDATKQEHKEAEETRQEAAKLLWKHFDPDDEMDEEFEALHGVYPQEAH